MGSLIGACSYPLPTIVYVRGSLVMCQMYLHRLGFGFGTTVGPNYTTIQIPYFKPKNLRLGIVERSFAPSPGMYLYSQSLFMYLLFVFDNHGADIVSQTICSIYLHSLSLQLREKSSGFDG